MCFITYIGTAAENTIKNVPIYAKKAKKLANKNWIANFETSCML